MTSHGAESQWDLRARAADHALVLRVPRAAEKVASARHAVRDYLAAHAVPSPIADDVQLVTSELVTNALVHGRAGWIDVEVAVDPTKDVILSVTNTGPAGAIPPVAEWRSPHALAPGGRGLGIVRRLCDEVEVRGDADLATVVCRRRWKRGDGE
jgi:anti-sigma regulatory factor (Ser/Thr protein kinase)